MPTTKTIHTKNQQLIGYLTKALARFDNIVFAYLYGSFARGEHHRFSDIDIAIYQREYSVENYLDVLASIDIDGREIDLRILNNAPPLFRYRVIKEGILLFCKDQKLHENFVFWTLIEALELIDIIREILWSKVQ